MPIPWNRWVDSPEREPEPPTCIRCGDTALPNYDLCPRCQFNLPLDPFSCHAEVERVQDEIGDLFGELETLEIQMRAGDDKLPVHPFWAEELRRLIEKRRF